METFDWDDDLLDLNLGCQNIFDEISLDVFDKNLSEDYYEPKSKIVVTSTIKPWVLFSL